MDEEHVGFGRHARKVKYPGEAHLKELLDAATDDEAEEYLTEYELGFAANQLDRLTTYGYREPSEKQQKVLGRIEEKLKDARIL